MTSLNEKESILDTIVKQRLLDVEEAKRTTSISELQHQIQKASLPAPLNLHQKLLENAAKGLLSVAAEVKRASPSKGDIAPNINAQEQGLKYADAGVEVISCLTEPKWFKGTLDDMKSIRQGLEGRSSRPILLRKDFLIDEYQIYEAKLYGADTCLLIVAAMTVLKNLNLIEDATAHLAKLLQIARSLQMEPLVEVNNDEEMKIALQVGSKVIGINNRNLHNFEVDLETTSRLVSGQQLPSDVIMVALSGIASRSDVAFFERAGVKAILVGETLMRANNPREKIKELRGERLPTLVKICGVMDPTMALAVAESGADFIGLVFAESRRKLSIEQGKEIASVIHNYRKQNLVLQTVTTSPSQSFTHWTKQVESIVTSTKPLIVGVFADNDPHYVNQVAKEVPLDIIQLSGHEGFSVVNDMVLPTVKALHVSATDTASHLLSQLPAAADQAQNLMGILLDTFDPAVKGGSGRAFNWDVAQELAQQVPFFLAGGLNPDNIASAVGQVNPWAVDVSSGVESDSKKDLQKVKQFITRAKQ